MCRGVGTHTPDMGPGVGTHPQLLIPSGSHHRYSRHAGGMHPTGMRSCFYEVLFTLIANNGDDANEFASDSFQIFL